MFNAKAIALSFIAALPTAAVAGLPDAGLFTTYSLPNDDTYVYFSVCGYLPDTEGCYGGGTLGPFGHVGAIIEGSPTVQGDTVTRGIYVVDIAAGNTGDEVMLYRYLKMDKASTSDDQVSTVFVKSIRLPLLGGVAARCSMAANPTFLFIGTDQSPFAVRVQKGASLAMEQVGGFSDNPTISSITSNDAGNVVLSFGAGGRGGIYVFGPDGQPLEDGGSASFTLTREQGFSTKDLPANSSDELANFKRSIKPRATAPHADTRAEFTNNDSWHE